MDSDRLNRRLTLIANFGVLIGIALLVCEIRQNHEMMRAQTRSEIAANAVDRLDFIAGNRELAEIIVRGNAGQELDAVDAVRLRFLRFGTFREWENTYYQHRQGLYDEQEYLAGKESWKSIVNRRNYQDYWCQFRLQVSSDFRKEVDDMFENLQCE